MTKHRVERLVSGNWLVVGSFNSEDESKVFFVKTLIAHPDWPLRRITEHEFHNGTSSSPVLKRLQAEAKDAG